MYGSHIRLLLISTLSFSCLISGCGDDDGGGGPRREVVTALRGTIRDASGAALSGVQVSGGGASATSRADGQYDLRVVAGPQVVHFEKAGFVTAVIPIEVIADSPTQRDLAMLPMAAAMPLDATAGGTVTGMRGAGLMAPPGAFVDGSGAPVTGMVDVHLTPVDPSVESEMRASSGDFTATSGGMRVALESLGMMDVMVRQGTETLQVASGMEIEIRIPAAAGAAAPDPTIQLWSIDEATGLWTDEGMAMLDGASGTYVARTRHMSMWNVDKPLLATCVCGVVNETGAGPLPGARVQADGVGYFGTSSATTDAMGRFCVAVKKSSEVAIAAYHASGGGESRRVTSGAEDTAVPAAIGDARCLDAGEWNVERDVFRSDTSGPVMCEDVGNPFATGCGAAFWGEMECYQPTGECTQRTEGTTTTITYASGSRIVSAFEGMTVTAEMYSPAGTLCATSVIDTSGGTGADVRVEYTIAASGTMYAMIIPAEETGDMVLECPMGESITITPEQRQAFQACYGDGSDGTRMCTPEGGAMIGSPCTEDAQCAGAAPDAVCCTIPMASSFCLGAADCTSAGGT